MLCIALNTFTVKTNQGKVKRLPGEQEEQIFVQISTVKHNSKDSSLKGEGNCTERPGTHPHQPSLRSFTTKSLPKTSLSTHVFVSEYMAHNTKFHLG